MHRGNSRKWTKNRGHVTSAQDENPPFVIEQKDDSEESPYHAAEENIPYPFPKNWTVFDFAELPAENFPRGTYSINQLIDSYGVPEELYAQYMPSHNIAWVKAEYEKMEILFGYKLADYFSFYNQSLFEKRHELSDDETRFELSEEDKSMEYDILSLRIYDDSLEFPHGIRIGQSTRSQVLESYPVDSGDAYQAEGEGYYVDILTYYYDFRDENGNLPTVETTDTGYINYRFDENELFIEADVQWRFFDL